MNLTQIQRDETDQAVRRNRNHPSPKTAISLIRNHAISKNRNDEKPDEEKTKLSHQSQMKSGRSISMADYMRSLQNKRSVQNSKPSGVGRGSTEDEKDEGPRSRKIEDWKEKRVSMSVRSKISCQKSSRKISQAPSSTGYDSEASLRGAMKKIQGEPKPSKSVHFSSQLIMEEIEGCRELSAEEKSRMFYTGEEMEEILNRHRRRVLLFRKRLDAMV